ncbi:DEAD/DEAH box helicase [Rhodopseudomonas sp. RCAM05734]|uniref:DEAD/DEAH box helicase n=1 Tax=Rhodopseudomonas sp. RCAM05734 TaxID=3457549 RepID=UPI004044EC3F
MRTKGLPPLEERFEFLGDGMTAGGGSPLSSAIFEVDDRRTGTPFNLKLWTKTSTAVDDDLRKLWLHEMRQIQRLGAYEGARDVIVEVVDIVEDETSFGIVLRQVGQTLSSRMVRAKPDHWLKNLALRQSRTLFWHNVARIAKAIGIVHLHGLVHGHIGTGAVMTTGSHQPDFVLGGFEWSLWFSAGEDDASHAKLQTERAAAGAGKHYSFEDDWRSFGSLIADCLGLRVEASGDLVLPEGSDSSYVDTSERALFKSLFVPTRQDVNDAATVGRAIDDILASTPHTRTVGNGTFIIAFVQKGVADAIYVASGGQVAVDDFRGQLDFIRADLAGGASLLIPSSFRPKSGRLTLMTDIMAYNLSSFDADDGQTWQIAFCGGAQAKGGLMGYGALEEHAVRQSIQVEGVRGAVRLRDRLGPDALDWSGFSAPVETEELDRVGTIRTALNLVEIVDTLVKAFGIFPIEVLQTSVEPGGRRLAVIRALPGSERDKIGKKIGLLETASALHRLFGEDHRDAARQWRISSSSDLGSSRYDDVVATFVDVVPRKGADAYQFEVDDDVNLESRLYLRADSETGTERVVGRHLAAIRALETRIDLAEMLDDSWRVRTSTNDAVDESNFDDLDGPKQVALRAIWNTRPSFFVVGPPGVGKTKLATEFIWRRFDSTSARVLLSSQGHDALDNLQREVKKALVTQGIDSVILVRSPSLGRKKKTPDDAPIVAAKYLELLSHSRMVSEAPQGQRERVGALAKEIKQSNRDSVKNTQARLSKTMPEDIRTGLRAMQNLVLDGADIVIAAANSSEIERFVEAREQFDWVIIEEAAKATGPELVGPMMLSNRRLLIGDHRQLPPFGADQTGKILQDHSLVETTLDVAEQYIGSLLRNGEIEELQTMRTNPEKLREVGMLAYRLLEPFRSTVEEDEKRLKETSLHRRVSATLTEQRRMDPAIAEIVSQAFYKGDLQTAPKRRKLAETGPSPILHLSPLPVSPIVVVDFPHVNATGSRRSLEQAKPRWHNPSEIESVVDVLRLIRATDSGDAPTLAVLSPYSAQVDLLTERIGGAIKNGELAHLNSFRSARDEGQGFVGTVDSFQGSEADIVVMSLVRNNEGSGSSALGFLRDRRRMNVAISRAKWKLVLVTSFQFLEEAVRGVNPDNEKEKHELDFLTTMIVEIRKATGEKRIDVPLATIMNPDELRVKS